MSVALVALLAASLLELAIRLVRARSGAWLLGDEQLLWQVPLSNALFFVPAALVLSLGGRALPRLLTAPRQAGALVALAAFAVLFLFHPALHLVALTVLAIGTGSLIGRSAVRATPMTPAGGARRIALAVIALAMLVIGEGAWRRWREGATIRALPAAPAGAPNVLFLVLDTVRAMSMSLYGHARHTTPHLDSLAAEGVAFSAAFSSSPWTLPSHATLFTGRYAHDLDAGWTKPLGGSIPTLASVLAAHGYRTGGFVANVGYASAEHGLQHGFAHYEDYGATPGDILVASSLGRFVANNARLRGIVNRWDVPGRKYTPAVARAFLRWRDRDASRPYFAFLNLYDAHEPYLPPEPFDTAFVLRADRDRSEIRFLNGRMAERTNKLTMTPRERDEEQLAYEAALAAMDDAIGDLVATLRARGELTNTIVIVTADHGEQFGEHGLYSHGNSLYEEALRVPLVIFGAGEIPPGTMIRSAVSLRDVPRTVLELAGLGADAKIPGRSLSTTWRGSSAPVSPVLASVEPAPNQNPAYPSSRGPMRAALAGGWLVIRGGAGMEAALRIQGAGMGEDSVSATGRARERLDSLARAAARR
jgi:arylsulfatase A-like enzyme